VGVIGRASVATAIAILHSRDPPALRVLPLEVQAEAGSPRVGLQHAIDRLRSAVEKELFNANVVVEILDVRNSGHDATQLGVD
jgi:hypothetical protein